MAWLARQMTVGQFDCGTLPGWQTGESGRIFAGMATRPKIRLLEVSVTAQKPTVWRWHISEHDLEVMHGYETSRESAQIEGDTALFKLLSVHRI